MFNPQYYFRPKPSTLLLDLYPNAKQAVSFYKLRSTYSGNCIRIRRNDNTEQDFGFVNDYLDTSSIITFLGAQNGYLKTWYDQSGNGIDISETTGANQPLIYNGTTFVQLYSGKVSVPFSTGANKGMSFTAYNLSNHSIFQTVNVKAVTGYSGTFMTIPATGTGIMLSAIDITTAYRNANAPFNNTAYTTETYKARGTFKDMPTGLYIENWNRNGIPSTATLKETGVSISASSSTAGGWSTYSNKAGFKGYLELTAQHDRMDLIVYDTVLTGAQITGINNILKTMYSL